MLDIVLFHWSGSGMQAAVNSLMAVRGNIIDLSSFYDRTLYSEFVEIKVFET